MVILVAALRYRRQRPAPRALLAPWGGDDPHPMPPLPRGDDVGPAEERPPARARLVHEGEAIKPQLLPERRRVAAEFAVVQLEAEHPQPIAQAQDPDHTCVPGHVGAAPPRREQLPQAPERGGIEARNDDLPLRYQDALGFA